MDSKKGMRGVGQGEADGREAQDKAERDGEEGRESGGAE